MLIRAAKFEDRKAIAALRARSWAAVYQDILPANFLATLAIEIALQDWIGRVDWGKSVHLVCELKDELVGWASSGIPRTEPAPGIAELYAIYVCPKVWHRGIGSRLLSDIGKDAREQGFEAIEAWVAEANLIARNFYEKHSFQAEADRTLERELGSTKLKTVLYRKVLVQDP